jgi:hypothetical protein
MCPKEANLIRLLVKNKIPIVLYFNEERAETYIYVSRQVKTNILDPLWEKREELDNIMCSNSLLPVTYSRPNSTLISHFCRDTKTFTNIVSVEIDPLRLLRFVHGISCDESYYGIKNGKIKVFTAEKCYPVIEDYLI